MNNREAGIKGEILARDYLKKKGYNILKTNFTCVMGEVDIIAKIGDTIVFVEVKSRVNEKFGRPIESITRKKANTIRKCAMYYQAHLASPNDTFRFDVIEVLRDEINHIEDAF